MTVYVLTNTYAADTRIEGVITSKAKADRWAESRGNWYDERKLNDPRLGLPGLRKVKPVKKIGAKR